jgi:methylated-DNA-[protein]-cysteine S-methyltransferase
MSASCYTYKTMLGTITIYANQRAVTKISFGERLDDINLEEQETNIIREAHRQLKEYFSGIRRQFNVDLEYSGTDFQLAVWEQLKKISYGETKAYKEIGCAIGNPKSAIAIGGACGKNPIHIFIPCHRVIGSARNLSGYAGGVAIKKKLLGQERKYANVASI